MVAVSFPFYHLVPLPVDEQLLGLTFRDHMVVCDLSQALDYEWKNPSAIYRICTVTSDLSAVPLSKFKKHRNLAGKEYYRVEYDLRMKLVNEVRLLTTIRCPYSNVEVADSYI